MLWRDQKDHCTDCYFCSVKIAGYKKHKWKIEYPRVPSAPVFAQIPCLEDVGYDADFEIEQDSVRKGLDQHEISDLVRDL